MICSIFFSLSAIISYQRFFVDKLSELDFRSLLSEP